MAQEPFLINPPKRLRRRVKASRGRRRRRNPIGETLVTIGANPSRRNPMRRIRRKSRNPWYGDSSGHRIAALMRWGAIPKGKVNRHRKRRRVKARHVVHRKVRRVKHRRKWAPSHVRMRRKLAQQAYWVDKYGEMLAHPRRKKYHYKTRGVKYYMRKTKRRRSRRRNTWFGQPRRHRKAAKKGWRRGHLLGKRGRRRRVRHNYFMNPMPGATTNPRRRRRHYNVKHRRRHRSHGRRRNPAIMAEFNKFSSSLMNVKHWAPLAVTGGLSAITGAVVPGMLGVVNPYMKYGVQVSVAIGGSILVERVAGREHGQAWMIVGIAMVGYQVLKDFVLVPYFPQFAVGLGAAPGTYEKYYPELYTDRTSQFIDAFPNAMHAFPSAVSDYPGVGDAGAYPYDGAGY